MKTNLIVLSRGLTMLLGLALIAVALPAFAAPKIFVKEQTPAPAAAYAPGEVLVKFKNSKMPFEVIHVPDVKAAVDALHKNPNIEFAEPNYVMTAFAVPDDPYYNLQWNFHSFETYGGVDAELAWDTTSGDNSVVVAVIDTGIAYEDYTVRHGRAIFEQYAQAPDLSDTCFVEGKDFVHDDTHPNDDNGHGTHVAGTIAQTTNNKEGVAGLAYNTCLMPIKVLGANGSGSTDDVALAIRHAADNGAKVINLSLGGPGSQTLLDAVAYAKGKGVTIVAATGNDNGAVSYPAAYDDYVIAVGATRKEGVRAPYSNYGSSIDLVAPGGYIEYDSAGNLVIIEGILQETLDNSTTKFAYYYYTGTSMATPHVSAAVALLLANDNTMTPDKVQATLEGSAHDLGDAGWDQYYGYGMINIPTAYSWTGGIVENRAPTADAGVDQAHEVTEGEQISVSVLLDGSNSSDPDDDVLTHTWSGGDIVETAPGKTYETTLTATGTYVYTLTVSDGEYDHSDDVVVTVTEAFNTPIEPTNIELTYTQDKIRGTMYAYLAWTPENSMDVYRDGVKIAENVESGSFTDTPGKGGGTYSYQVCGTGGTANCSNEVTISF